MGEPLRHNMTFDLFLRCLTEACDSIDETEIIFLDDLERGECIMGYIPYLNLKDKTVYFDHPYWVGTGCDIEDGAEFKTAEELLHAEIYGGRSIFQSWEQVSVLNLGMVPLEDWFNACSFEAEVFNENGIWKLRTLRG